MNKKVYLIRKSKWLLAIIFAKIFIILSFWLLTLYIIIYSLDFIKEHSLTQVVIFLSYILTFFVYFEIIISLTNYFYDIIIIDNKSIHRFRLWLLFKEYVFILDLYMIQEVDSHLTGFISVLLNVWELNILELKDRVTTIHFIDNPQKVAKNIRELQYKFVDKDRNPSNNKRNNSIHKIRQK